MRTIEIQKYIVKKDSKGWEAWQDGYIINATDVSLAEALLKHIDGPLPSVKCRFRYADDYSQFLTLSGNNFEDSEFLRKIQ